MMTDDPTDRTLELHIQTRLTEWGWRCYAETPRLGMTVLSQARTIQRAQLRAIVFCRGNFPDHKLVWEGGYEGGNPDDALPQNTYWGDN